MDHLFRNIKNDKSKKKKTSPRRNNRSFLFKAFNSKISDINLRNRHATKMLWQKESSTDGALYTDILQNTEIPLASFRLNRMKNGGQSVSSRKTGNDEFGRNYVAAAMNAYNKSICFAEKGSEDLGLAYANRATCFLKLKLYEQCLTDIQLARDANYPARLMSKLNERERECLKRLSSTVTEAPEPKLSFAPHEKLPCMANVLEVAKNEQYGRLVRAKRDLQMGEVILVEEAYIQILYGREYNRCHGCLKENANFVPCDNCADVMFCSEKCANNNFHEAECDMSIGSEDFCDGQSVTFILRSIIIAINTFATAEDLIEFVEKCRESDRLDVTESVATPISKYRTFFGLAATVTDERISELLSSSYVIYNAIMGSRLAGKFETKASQRFLMHLTIHHGLILRVNAFSGYTEPPSGIFGQAVADDSKQTEREIHLLSSYFNHSCIPNVIKLVKDNVAVCTVLLPIKKGDQLFITYIDDETFDMAEKERNDQLELIYGFRCKCEFCRNGGRTQQRLQTDPDFQYIAHNLPQLIESSDIKMFKEMKKRCIDFLKRHHLQSIASREAGFVLTNFGSMLQRELDGF